MNSDNPIKKNFAIIGVGGYVAPRHLKAIKETGNDLVSAYDKSDSVGIIDSYFPQASFFNEQELFDRHNTRLKRSSQQIEMLSVCTPNYLHDAHCRYGLRLGADVICEKPICLNPWNIDALKGVEEETGRKIYTILQLRLHPAILALKEQVNRSPQNKVFDIDLTYITSRGLWYYASWKGDERKSGGIATNIGVHFYDMLLWIFGPLESHVVHLASHDRCSGIIHLKRANIRYMLSINCELLPEEARKEGKTTYRVLAINGKEIEFSRGFTELHTESYRQILEGKGFGLEDAYPAIDLVYRIRHAKPIGLKGDYHPLASIPQSPHPFGWRS